jgi:hypothetical protein
MQGQEYFMRKCVLILVLVLVGAGCQENELLSSKAAAGTEPIPPLTAPQRVPPAPPSAPATQPTDEAPAGGEVMAYVNGSPLYMNRLYDLLLYEYGLKLSRQIIANALVEQAAAAKNFTARDDEIDVEHDQTLQRMFPGEGEPARREWLLDQLLQRRDFSREQWRMTMRRNVLLAKLAAPAAETTEAELRDEFAGRYGRKVVVRHIQSASLAESQEVLQKLRAGEDFAKLAEKVSKNPSAADGGQLPPIGVRTEGVPAALREAALSMKEPGEISEPVQVQTAFHVLYLQEVVEPQDVQFEDVRMELFAAVRARKLRVATQQLRLDLIRNAKIDYVNAILKNKAAAANEENLP